MNTLPWTVATVAEPVVDDGGVAISAFEGSADESPESAGDRGTVDLSARGNVPTLAEIVDVAEGFDERDDATFIEQLNNGTAFITAFCIRAHAEQRTVRAWVIAITGSPGDLYGSMSLSPPPG